MDTVIDFVKVGHRIRQTREKHSMKQKDLAEKRGTNANHLSDIERGKKRASLEMSVQISNILDTLVVFFLKDTPMVCQSYRLYEDVLPLLKQFNPQSLCSQRSETACPCG